MKVFALFLPQFHSIEENNQWWGEGFTEWNNVKNAKALYKGHDQPQIPLNDYYYDLTKKETVIWQTDLMNKYGIDGLVYYHYYFNGHMLLEKPAENLLEWKDINQPFFFNWANHSWYRSWAGSKELLIEQTYGDRLDWEKHFRYLLPFFKDDRYIKIDNKPVFMIYDADFSQKNEMFLLFDELCQKNGFNGIYLIEECSDMRQKQYSSFRDNISKVTEKIYITQPSAGKKLYIDDLSFIRNIFFRINNRLTQKGISRIITKFDGDKIISLISKNRIDDKKIIPGIFFNWDNTPRHRYRGSVITKISKRSFMDYMDGISKSDFVIINAWNEWAEGMVLEPSDTDGYKYLEWIREWKNKK